MNNYSLVNYGDIIRLGNGAYKVLKQLGQGKNGKVYLVLCVSGINLGYYFALKLFYRIDLEGRRKRFLFEIEFLKTHEHPAIINYYDDGEYFINDKAYPVIIESYMPSTLEQELASEPLNFDKALTYTTQLFSAVRYLQKLNILHRDIKPANIFVNNSQLVLGDFGLVKNLKDTKSPTENIEFNESSFFRNSFSNGSMPRFFRTPQLLKYQRKEAQLNLKSDIFQLGLVLAVLFLSINPVKVLPANNITMELNKLPFIQGEYTTQIADLINKMINLNEDEIPNIDELCELFNKIYNDYLLNSSISPFM